jgi:uncharacterized protein (TIGR02145 family)
MKNLSGIVGIFLLVLIMHSCKKDDFPCIDGDGNLYYAVTIGTQTWMTENLKTTKYNDGTNIPLVIDSIAWSNLTTPAYCWYNNDEATYKNVYGALYNWHAVNTGKLCPIGWHVPTDEEWTTLTTYLGGESVAGGKLKEVGIAHWTDPNTGATNEVGFTALPGGFRFYNGEFRVIGLWGLWWSTTTYKYHASLAYCRGTGFLAYQVYNEASNKQCGKSVRCVKD